MFVDTDCLKIGHYVAAVYGGQWCPSLILEINWDQRDLLSLCITVVMTKTAFFGHYIVILYHSPTLD